MNQRNHVFVNIKMKENELLGATPNDKLIIVRIQPKTLANGKLFVGDQIVSVNNEKVKDVNHFYELLRCASPTAKIKVIRNENLNVKLSSENQNSLENQIPPEREKLIDRLSGFDYLLIRVDIAKGKKLGLSISDSLSRVLVSKIKPGSISDGKLMLHDQIIDVNGKRVFNKDVTRELIVNSIKENGYFSCIIGRPATADIRHSIDSLKNDSPSIILNEDVREIAQRQRENEQKLAKNPEPRKSIITKGKVENRPKVSFNEEDNKHFNIGNDNKGKVLRSVKKTQK